jgi:hypothetical protein
MPDHLRLEVRSEPQERAMTPSPGTRRMANRTPGEAAAGRPYVTSCRDDRVDEIDLEPEKRQGKQDRNGCNGWILTLSHHPGNGF